MSKQPAAAAAAASDSATSTSSDDGDADMMVSASELQILKETFQLFDKDGDGCITTEELGTVLRCIGGSHSAFKLKEMLRRIDKDGNGTIEFEEFIQLMKSDPKRRRHQQIPASSSSSGEQSTEPRRGSVDADSEDELLAAFHVFDKDKNGYISAPELKTVLAGLGHEYEDEEVEEMLKEVDINGDGLIDYTEFVAMLTGSPLSRVPSRLSTRGGGDKTE